MTRIRHKGFRGREYEVVAPREEREPDLPVLSARPAHDKRVKALKRVQRVVTDPVQKMDQLVDLAKRFGPDRLRREIDLHRVKIEELEEALRRAEGS